MSRRLAALEARLGVRLVERGPRRFTLTEEGNVLHERILNILGDLDEAEAAASVSAQVPRGRLRVGAPLEIGRRRIAPLVAQLSEQYPHITVDLLLGDARLDVLGEELDVGLHVDRPNDGNVVSRALITSRRVACASPDYVSRHPAPATPADLGHHDCIRLIRGRHIFDHWPFMEKGKIIQTPIGGTLCTNNSEVMHEWALAGRGVALKAEWDVEDDLRTGRLVEFLAPFACNEIKLYATYPSRNYLPPRTRVFIDFMAAKLAQ